MQGVSNSAIYFRVKSDLLIFVVCLVFLYTLNRKCLELSSIVNRQSLDEIKNQNIKKSNQESDINGQDQKTDLNRTFLDGKIDSSSESGQNQSSDSISTIQKKEHHSNELITDETLMNKLLNAVNSGEINNTRYQDIFISAKKCNVEAIPIETNNPNDRHGNEEEKPGFNSPNNLKTVKQIQFEPVHLESSDSTSNTDTAATKVFFSNTADKVTNDNEEFPYILSYKKLQTLVLLR